MLFIFSGCSSHLTQSNHYSNSNSGYSSQNNSSNTQIPNSATLAINGFKRRQTILSKEQKNIFWELNKRYANKNIILLVKVNIGEIVTNEDINTYLSVANCKRVDILIVDRNFNPLLAIDYNKDSVSANLKQDIFKSANIEYLNLKEIDFNYLISTINNKITPILSRHNII